LRRNGFLFSLFGFFIFTTLVSNAIHLHTVASDLTQAAALPASEPSAAASPTSSTRGAAQSGSLILTLPHYCQPHSPRHVTPRRPFHRKRSRSNRGSGGGGCGGGGRPRRRRRHPTKARQGGKNSCPTKKQKENNHPARLPPDERLSAAAPAPLAALYPNRSSVEPASGRWLKVPATPPQPWQRGRTAHRGCPPCRPPLALVSTEVFAVGVGEDGADSTIPSPPQARCGHFQRANSTSAAW